MAVGAFLSVEVILAVLIQCTSGDVFRTLCYLSVLLAFFCSLFLLLRGLDGVLLSAGLLFTLVADFYLVVLDDYYAVAVSFFSVAQLVYAARLWVGEGSAARRGIHLWTRLAVAVLSILIPIILLGEKADYLSVICVFYFANLLLNTAFTFLNAKNYWLFGVGLVLFCLCDVFIGLSKLGMYFRVESDAIRWLSKYGYKIAWVFYVPSQAVIAVSPLALTPSSDASP